MNSEDKKRAARRAVEDYRRDAMNGRNPKPWNIIRWLEHFIEED